MQQQQEQSSLPNVQLHESYSCHLHTRFNHYSNGSALSATLPVYYTEFHSAPSANYSIYSPSTWHPDSAATNHITSDLNQLNIAEDYKGLDNLVVGNGQGLLIPHTGFSILRSQNHSFKLINML